MNDMCNNCICLNVDCKGSQESVLTRCIFKKTAQDLIRELKQKIEDQKNENIRLYNIFQYRLHEEAMQPIIKQWYDGSSKLKQLDDELYEMEKKERNERLENESSKQETKTFINGFGEATNKYITSSTYERAEKRRQKEIISFMGNR